MFRIILILYKYVDYRYIYLILEITFIIKYYMNVYNIHNSK